MGMLAESYSALFSSISYSVVVPDQWGLSVLTTVVKLSMT